MALDPIDFGFMGPIRLPVPPEAVALLKLPVSVTPLYEISKHLGAAYGPDLVIRYDLTIDGWLVICTPSPEPSGSGPVAYECTIDETRNPQADSGVAS